MTKRPFVVRNAAPRPEFVEQHNRARAVIGARLSNAGTSEGAKKGWESRRGGGSGVDDGNSGSRTDFKVGQKEDGFKITRIGKTYNEVQHPDGTRIMYNKETYPDPFKVAKQDAEDFRKDKERKSDAADAADAEKPDFKAGAESGSHHDDSNPLHRENLKKADMPHESEKVRDYWRGYKQAAEDKKKAAAANSSGRDTIDALASAVIPNAGNSEGAKKGWLTRKGGIRADGEITKDDGSKHVKLTIQGSGDDQKDVEIELPKDIHEAVASGKFKPNPDLEKHSKGEDFHAIHGYEPVGPLRDQYGKGGDVDKFNSIIGGAIGRAKAYYVRSREYPDGSEASLALKAKAEQMIGDIAKKYVPAREEAKKKVKEGGAVGVANSRYARIANRIKAGVIANYSSRVQDMLDEVEEYSENGEALPDDLREEYEEWMEENGDKW